MTRRFLFAALIAVCVGGALPARAASRSTPAFLENAGQLHGAARYYAQGSGGAVYFEPDAVVLDHAPTPVRNGVVMRISFPGASGTPRLSAGAAQSGRVNVMSGERSADWKRGLATYGEVRYGRIAEGAEIVYRVVEGRLKYDVVVAPGAEVGAVRLRYEGIERLEIAADGHLRIHTGAGTLDEQRPVLYQEREGRRIEVRGGYRLVSERELGFWASGVDVRLPLIVDPGMTWSTFMGGSGVDAITASATDVMGNLYVAGYSASSDYPLTTGVYSTASAGYDVVVGKFREDGTLLWSTRFGGGGTDVGAAIAVDATGNVYVAGNTNSTNFPVTAGAFRGTLKGGLDVFVTKLSSTGGALTYSTYLGGTADDAPSAIAVDASGNAFVAGMSSSYDFPTTAGVVRPSHPSSVFPDVDGFVAKLNAAGNGLVYSTYLGSTNDDAIKALALDAPGQVTVAGYTSSAGFPTTPGAFQTTYQGTVRDAFVTRLNATASGYVFSTFLGGTDADVVYALALDATGNTWVGGSTASTSFPTTSGAIQSTYAGGTYDGFVSRFSATGALTYSSFLGGNGTDAIYALRLAPGGQVCVGGSTSSTNFAVTSGSYSASNAGGTADAFMTALSPDGSRRVYSTYLGSPGNDQVKALTVLPSGRVVVSGSTDNAGFPTTANAYSRTFSGSGSNGFVTSFDAGFTVALAVEDRPFDGIEMSAGPNPFVTRTSIAFTLKDAEPVSLRIMDLEGRTIQVLAEGASPAGRHDYFWNGRDAQGVRVAAGAYFVSFSAAGQHLTKRVIKLD